MTNPIYQIRSLNIQRGDTLLIKDLQLDVFPGERWCILGKNGSGKTSLLATLAGLTAPEKSTLAFMQQPLSTFRRKQLSQHIGYLFQEYPDSFPITVRNAVLAGRFPHLRSWQSLAATDQTIAENALAFVQMSDFARRELSTLSGGERRRVALATILAQQPDLFLLDEPVNHLDLHFQASLLPELCQHLTRQGKTLIMSLHDINLATRLCDKCLLLSGDGSYIAGETHQVINQQALENLYQTPFEQIQARNGPVWLPVIPD